MKTIHKYQLNYGITSLQLPQGAIPIHADLQQDVPTLWVEVDTQMPLIHYNIHIVGTGHQMAESISPSTRLSHVSTFQEGGLVWHIYYQLGE